MLFASLRNKVTYSDQVPGLTVKTAQIKKENNV